MRLTGKQLGSCTNKTSIEAGTGRFGRGTITHIARSDITQLREVENMRGVVPVTWAEYPTYRNVVERNTCIRGLFNKTGQKSLRAECGTGVQDQLGRVRNWVWEFLRSCKISLIFCQCCKAGVYSRGGLAKRVAVWSWVIPYYLSYN